MDLLKIFELYFRTLWHAFLNIYLCFGCTDILLAYQALNSKQYTKVILRRSGDFWLKYYPNLHNYPPFTIFFTVLIYNQIDEKNTGVYPMSVEAVRTLKWTLWYHHQTTKKEPFWYHQTTKIKHLKIRITIICKNITNRNQFWVNLKSRHQTQLNKPQLLCKNRGKNFFQCKK